MDEMASRELSFTQDGSPVRKITVRIGRPTWDEGEELWHCPYEIVGFDKPRQYQGAGVDSMQSLVLAQQKVMAELHRMAEDHGGTFSWLRMTDDLGFEVRDIWEDVT